MSKKTTVLKKEDFLQHLELYRKNGDKKSLEILVESNQGLIGHLIKKHSYLLYVHQILDYDDLFQIGNIGLLNAINHYDVHQEVDFSTYASVVIERTMVRELCNYTNYYCLPVNAFNHFRQICKIMNDYLETHNETITFDLLKKSCPSIREETLKNLWIICHHIFLPLDKFVRDDDENTFADLFIEDKSARFENKTEDNMFLEYCFSKITAKEKNIIFEHFYNNKTLKEIGKIHGVSHERIRQIEKNIFEKLQNEI